MPSFLIGSDKQNLSPQMAEVANQKQSAALATDKTLRAPEFLDTGVKKRRFDFIWKVGIPAIAVFFVVSNFLGGSKPSPVAAPVSPTPALPIAFAQPTFPAVSSFGPSVRVTEAPLSVRCYATVASGGQLGGSDVGAQGLFLAEKFTRVSGGLVYSTKFGWHAASDFGCDKGLERLEVEFVLPTPTRTRVPYVPSTPTKAIPTIIASPTPTLVEGINSFQVTNCIASWLVWRVKEVYLVSNSQRVPVPGDDKGRAVQMNLPYCAGIVRLEAVSMSGALNVREIVLSQVTVIPTVTSVLVPVMVTVTPVR